ncbi:MAG: zinc dependent phospholipase C family protein [Anaerotruncus sp.]|nr:zinc dependent phospholipase C family protein [Anaerotruncus sp.]
MNLFSHITMGRYLYTYFTEQLGVKLDKSTFVRWNFLPDIAPSLLRLSHFKKDIYDLVMARAEHLAANSEQMSVEEFSKQLGILCHFMADFFCYAHSETFDGSKIGHLTYELKMQFYAYRRKDMLHAVNLIANAAQIDSSLALYEQINELHSWYMELAPSYGVDFVYSLTACVELMRGMLYPAYA